ncbi:MAG: NfeD family protein [Pseudomonadota bacterium]
MLDWMRRYQHGMRSRLRWFWMACLTLGLGMALVSVASENGQRSAVVLDVAGPIGPATSDYVLRGMASARDQGAEIIVIRMDTPGGLDSAMRMMIKEILNSPIPVVTWVTPSGARAASAGTYMLYASHIAAMSSSTNLGSATPVKMGGMPGQPEQPPAQDPPESQEEKSESDGDNANGAESGEGADTDSAGDDKRRGDTAMERKVLEDAVAYIRGLAERHDRNVDWAEEAVREAVNLTASDALEKNVIDVVADTLDELFTAIDGRTVRMDTGEQTLQTDDLQVVEIEPDWRTELLSVITNPNIAYFLMLIGFYGIIFELSSPGNIYPGVIGAISLLLALYAFQALPINYAGLALIALGIAFMVGEAFMPSFGALGLGGIVAFVSGSIILMDDENLAISIPLIASTALVSAGFFMWVLARLIGLRKRQVVSGVEELIGAEAVAMADFDGSGRVWLHGESWWADAEGQVQKGQRLRVTEVKGLRVKVEPLFSHQVNQQGARE